MASRIEEMKRATEHLRGKVKEVLNNANEEMSAAIDSWSKRLDEAEREASKGPRRKSYDNLPKVTR